MKINQLTLPSLDIEKSVSFYQELGLRLIVLDLPHYARFVNEEDKVTLSVHLVDSLSGDNGVIVYFECEDLLAKVNQLKSKGFVFEHDIIHQSWLWSEAKMRDPFGNELIFFHAGENRLNPPWKI